MQFSNQQLHLTTHKEHQSVRQIYASLYCYQPITTSMTGQVPETAFLACFTYQTSSGMTDLVLQTSPLTNRSVGSDSII